MALPDEKLVKRVLGGSEDAFRDLVRRYERPVFSIILRMIRDPADAEEIAQEVFVKAYRALSSFDPTKKFSSWIFKIAHNAAIDRLRRKRLSTVPLEGSGDTLSPVDFLVNERAASAETRTRQGEIAQAFEVALARLRPEYREVMVLRFQEELAYEEIAEVTGLALGTVKTHIHRARKQMAEALTELGWGPKTTP